MGSTVITGSNVSVKKKRKLFCQKHKRRTCQHTNTAVETHQHQTCNQRKKSSIISRQKHDTTSVGSDTLQEPGNLMGHTGKLSGNLGSGEHCSLSP